MVSGECFRDKQWKDEAGFAVDLHWLRLLPYLSPADGLIRPRPTVRTVELLRSVNEHAVVRPVPHQVRVADVVLHQTAAQDDHTW